MKRLIAALLLTTAVSALPLTGAGTAMGDSVKGPACGDITADAVYTTFGGVPTVGGHIETAKASCDRATYTLSVYALHSTVPLGEASVIGDGVTTGFNLSVAPPDSPTTVCASLSSSIGGRLVDQAPNGPDGDCAIGTQLVYTNTGASGMR